MGANQPANICEIGYPHKPQHRDGCIGPTMGCITNNLCCWFICLLAATTRVWNLYFSWEYSSFAISYLLRRAEEELGRKIDLKPEMALLAMIIWRRQYLADTFDFYQTVGMHFGHVSWVSRQPLNAKRNLFATNAIFCVTKDSDYAGHDEVDLQDMSFSWLVLQTKIFAQQHFVDNMFEASFTLFYLLFLQNLRFIISSYGNIMNYLTSNQNISDKGCRSNSGFEKEYLKCIWTFHEIFRINV